MQPHGFEGSYFAELSDYLQTNRVHELFDMLVKELAANQPPDPLTYLIRFLKESEGSKVNRVLVIGPDPDENTRWAEFVQRCSSHGGRSEDLVHLDGELE